MDLKDIKSLKLMLFSIVNGLIRIICWNNTAFDNNPQQIHCSSIGKIAKCQPLFLAPHLTLPQPTLALFYRLGKFWSICFCCEKSFFFFCFTLLFVGKHLKEAERLNDKGVCIQSEAVLKDCMEEWSICWGRLALGGAMVGEWHGVGPRFGRGRWYRWVHVW